MMIVATASGRRRRRVWVQQGDHDSGWCFSLAVHDAPKQIVEMQRMLQDELPEDNYAILKFVIQFLVEVSLQFSHPLLCCPFHCSVFFFFLFFFFFLSPFVCLTW